MQGQVSPTGLQVRVGGIVAGNDITITVAANNISGRCGGDVIGFDLDLKLDGVHATGRLGGPMIGMSVDGFVEDTLPVIAGFLFAVTYYIYRLNHRNRGSSSHSRN